jgi:hypothetical protein
MMKLKAKLKCIITLFIAIFVFFVFSVDATPSIVAHNNSISANLYPHQNVNTNIQFNVSANESITTWSWFVDGVNVSNNYNNLTKSWTTSGQKNVTVSGNNVSGSTSAISWYPIIEREKSTASDKTAALNTSWYDSLLNSFKGSTPSLLAFTTALVLPFTNTQTGIGNFFYLFLYGLPMLVIWIRQEKALIPAGLGIIFGAFFLGQLPESYIGVAVLFMILTVFGIIYSLYKERG